METREIRGIQTSLLGFGCMRFPLNEEGGIDRARSLAMLDAAYDAGVRYYDTAYPYHNGESERVLGEWLRTKCREDVLVATKLPLWKADSEQMFRDIFAEQQEKLGTDYFDFYLMHAVDAERFETVKKINAFAVLDELKAAGKIRRAGFSFHDSYEVFEQVLNAYDWDFCQLQINYMDRDIQAGLRGVELAKSKGIPVIVMEPVKGGYLANPPAEVRAVFDSLHPEWSAASWALRWVASVDNVAVILSGMSDEQQVADNLATFAHTAPLTDEEQAAVAEAARLYRARTRVPCTGCRYCMPCPAGVDIPGVFRIWNEGGLYGDEAALKQYRLRMDEKSRADVCVACGKCASVCPQHIDVPEMMKQAAAWANE